MFVFLIQKYYFQDQSILTTFWSTLNTKISAQFLIPLPCRWLWKRSYSRTSYTGRKPDLRVYTARTRKLRSRSRSTIRTSWARTTTRWKRWDCRTRCSRRVALPTTPARGTCSWCKSSATVATWLLRSSTSSSCRKTACRRTFRTFSRCGHARASANLLAEISDRTPARLFVYYILNVNFRITF